MALHARILHSLPVPPQAPIARAAEPQPVATVVPPQPSQPEAVPAVRVQQVALDSGLTSSRRAPAPDLTHGSPHDPAVLQARTPAPEPPAAAEAAGSATAGLQETSPRQIAVPVVVSAESIIALAPPPLSANPVLAAPVATAPVATAPVATAPVAAAPAPQPAAPAPKVTPRPVVAKPKEPGMITGLRQQHAQMVQEQEQQWKQQQQQWQELQEQQAELQRQLQAQFKSLARRMQSRPGDAGPG